MSDAKSDKTEAKTTTVSGVDATRAYAGSSGPLNTGARSTRGAVNANLPSKLGRDPKEFDGK